MFISFFYYLRARGLHVSLDEWLMLMDALDRGMAQGSFTRFYYLCRAVLIKSEAEYDAFNRAFLEYFKELKNEAELPPELLSWLNNPNVKKDNYDEWAAYNNSQLSHAQIHRMFLERLREQDSEHNGGSYWIGTGGMSVFGNDGNSPAGIRVGGQSRYRRAMEVAGSREYEDFRDDIVVGNRQFQVALRRLRQFSNRVDAPKEDLDVDGTIRATGDQAGRLKIVYQKPRKNTVKLLLLMDSGGSMDQYRALCSSLFQAVSASNHFKDFKIYYFHNCVYSRLYTTPVCSRRESIETEWVLKNLSSDYKVIILGDAMMDPSELIGGRYNYGAPARGMEWLQKLKKRFDNIAWFTPEPMYYAPGSFWRQSYDIISREFDMYVLTVQDLSRAFKRLLGAKRL